MQKYIPVLSIAGSDSGGGAGIQADLKTFAALGCYGTSAITAVTVQNTLGVTAIHPIPAQIVAAQIKAVLDDIKPLAIKIGMMHNADTVKAIAGVISAYPDIPVVVDPVMISSSGRKLMEDDTVVALRQHLFPLITLLTPNMDEAAVLSGIAVNNVEDMKLAAVSIAGCKAVLVKGGHLSGNHLINVYHDADLDFEVASEAIKTNNTHGTGCTLSSAIAAFLARGYDMKTAVTEAGVYLNKAIFAGRNVKLGEGHGPVNHFFDPIKHVPG